MFRMTVYLFVVCGVGEQVGDYSEGLDFAFSPHFSQDGEDIAQGFGFTGDLSLRVE